MKRTTFGFLTALTVIIWASASAFADPAETEIEAPGPKGPLKGLMVSVDKPDAPVVLIIPGSGPVDRDGNSLHGLNTDTCKLLAQGLAARGIASVRIDKRGMRSSAAAIPNANDVTIADYASDVHSWAATILKQTGGKCIWVLGHSEGGLVAMAAAKDNQADICGLLLVATPGRPFSDLIKDQIRSNPANAAIQDEAGDLQEPGSFGWFVIRSTGFATGVADAGAGWIFRR
jgi:pimeloyl-ACP methyl ester carboxylesterase